MSSPTGLDAAQDRAARAEAPRVLVLAGAGSGKTRCLIGRVTHLVRERAVPPERILLATFTQRAAREIRARAEGALGPAARRLRAGTFHALALAELRASAEALGLDPGFTLLDRDERRLLLGEALAASGVDPRGRPGIGVERFERLLGRALNDERELSATLLEHGPDHAMLAEPLERAAERYAHAKARLHALDFDDLLVSWRHLLDPERPASAELTAALDHVLVDEYQDTTPIQAGLAEDLARFAHLFVVGDDAQSIYGFRGARFENILEFPTHAPTEVHRLVTSYRSSPEVVALARATLDGNPLQFPKPLGSACPPGPPVELLIGVDEADEARRIARRARELADAGLPFDAQAVLVRRHRDADPIELALAEAGVPYHLRAGRRFVDRPHVAGALGYLRVLARPDDELAWRRVLPLWSGLGPVSVGRLAEALTAGGSERPSERLREAMGAAALPARAQASGRRLARLLEDLEPRVGAGAVIAALLDAEDGRLPLLAPSDAPDEALDDLRRLEALGDLRPAQALEELGLEGAPPADPRAGIAVSTVHAAKGLEWAAVFVPGLADGRFPPSGALGHLEGEAEERRLFYVAVTRAARHLVLSRPRATATAEGRMALDPSRFLDELAPGLYREIDELEDTCT